MSTTSSYGRTIAALGLVLAAVLSVAWTVLQPPFPAGYADRLAAIEDAGTSAVVSALLFALSQLPMLVAVLAIGRLAGAGAPRLAAIGTTLGVLGAFGHAVFGGVSLTTVVLAQDAAHRDVHAAVLEDLEGAPALIPFMAAGLLGTVLGLLLLGIALWRSQAVDRWVPAVLWTFLVVEFVGTSLSDYATYASALCLLVAFGALAKTVHQSRPELWVAGSAPQPQPTDPALTR